MKPLLEVSRLTKYFGGLAAVKDVDFDVYPGEIFGLIGPNGAGKTTIFNLINGFYRPTSGVIKFKGRNINGLNPHKVCKLGIGRTFQLVKPLLRLTVLQNVMVGAFARTESANKAREEAEKQLEFVGLLDKRDRLASGLTIADKKRLEMARALATKPTLLLLDEVAAGLNPKETADMMDLIRKIRDDGTTIIVVEHVMRMVMGVSDRIMVLHHGEKIAVGKPKEVATDGRVIEAYLGEAYRA